MRLSEQKASEVAKAESSKKLYRVHVEHFPNFTAVHEIKAHTRADALSKLLKKLKFKIEKLS